MMKVCRMSDGRQPHDMYRLELDLYRFIDKLTKYSLDVSKYMSIVSVNVM